MGDKVKEFNWYIVQTYTNYEDKAKKALEKRIKQKGLEEFFDEIYIPTETVTEVSGGQKKQKEKRFYKSYIFVRMKLDERAWHTVENTPKVVGFVGGDQNPRTVPESEVKGIADKIEEGSLKAAPQHQYETGDEVRIVDGNFRDFKGTVEEVLHEKEKVKVFVEIFGRPTSVEFDFDQVDKVKE
jgi:transcriptional antiterminator NusG